MELVKKNILSIICGVVAIAAIVASFVPLGGYITALQNELNQSKSTHDTLQGLSAKTRNLPILSIEDTTPRPLGMFPNKAAIEKAKAVVKEVETQSINMRDAAVRMNKRNPLVARSLPAPLPNDQITFRNAYVRLTTPGPNGELPQILAQHKAGVLPPQAEILRVTQLQHADIQANRVVRGVNGQVANQEEINQLIAEASVQIPLDMRKNVAERSKFYVEPTTLDLAPGVGGKDPPRVDIIWWAQVGLWVQQDALAAISEANKNAENLTKAPVKHVRKISVPFTNAFVTAGAAPVAAAGDPLAAADQPITKTITASPTGRVSNGMYDVVQFRMDLVVEVDQIPSVLRAISHNRLMSAYQVEVKAIDAEQALLAGYYYGEKPVADVTMSCEALLLRHWTIPLMPVAIKKLLGVPEAAPAAPAPAAPTAMAH